MLLESTNNTKTAQKIKVTLPQEDILFPTQFSSLGIFIKKLEIEKSKTAQYTTFKLI